MTEFCKPWDYSTRQSEKDVKGWGDHPEKKNSKNEKRMAPATDPAKCTNHIQHNRGKAGLPLIARPLRDCLV